MKPSSALARVARQAASCLSRAVSVLHRLLAQRRSSIAALTALAAVPLMLMAGVAIDGARLWMLQSRLQVAVDAATLLGAKEITATTRNTDVAALFWANFEQTTANGTAGFLGATSAGPTTSQINNQTVQVSAQATLPMTFMQLAGFKTWTVSASATAVSATTGLELALVLDNTGSMAGWPISAVISSATSLVNILYANGTVDTEPNLWVSIVPFAAEVNIGTTNTGWLAGGSVNQAPYANATWSGCVLARHASGHDFDDAPPSTAPFTPFFWASTKGVYTNKNGQVVLGDNDWTPTTITEGSQSLGNNAVGPNLGCVLLPILGETASRTTLLNLINQMVPTYRGGTFINLGLQAGWFTLSPKWRGLWGSPTLPLAYNTPFMQKAIVLMTDGNNEWYSWNGTATNPQNGGAPDNGTSKQYPNGQVDDTAYGRIYPFPDNQLGSTITTQTKATDYIDNAMATMCTNIKNDGIIIYTILFTHDTVSSATQTLFQNCASNPSYYFVTPTAADLQAAFSTIGSQLAALRLSQ
jgi:Flp pilus assembly protein TadG